MLADILDAQLEGSGKPGLEGGAQPVRERAPDVLGADEIEFRRLRPPQRRKLDRIELELVEAQASTLDVEAL
jgi:hypothetical protein